MIADTSKNPFEALSGLGDMLKNSEVLKAAQNPIPNWARYINITPGSKLESIIETGMKMHAAISGEMLYVEKKSLKHIELDDIKKLVEDIDSKINLISEIFINNTDMSMLDYHFVSDDSYIFINKSYLHSSILMCSFNKENINIINRYMEYYKNE